MKFPEFPTRHKYYIKRISLVIKIWAFKPDCLGLNPRLAISSCVILGKSLNLTASLSVICQL